MTAEKCPSGLSSPHRHVDDSLATVREALVGLAFGSVTLSVHEGRIVQIDVTERKRLKP